MRTFRIKRVWLTLIVLVAFGCTPEDDERCGDDYKYADGICEPLVDTDVVCPEDTDPDTDGFERMCDGVCNTCSGLTASYCAMQPGDTEGYCTYEDCTVAPDDCPAPYSCCDSPFGVFCANEADYAAMVGAGFCGEE